MPRKVSKSSASESIIRPEEVPVPKEIRDRLGLVFRSKRLFQTFLAEAGQLSSEEEGQEGQSIWQRMSIQPAAMKSSQAQVQSNTIDRYLKKTSRSSGSGGEVAVEIEPSLLPPPPPPFGTPLKSRISSLREVSFNTPGHGSKLSNWTPVKDTSPLQSKNRPVSCRWNEQEWYLQLKEAYGNTRVRCFKECIVNSQEDNTSADDVTVSKPKDCFEEVLHDGKPNEELFFSDSIMDDDEIYIVQCPKEMDASLLSGKEIHLKEESRMCLTRKGKKEIYEFYPQINDERRNLNLILPSQEKGKFVLVSHPLAGTIVVSEGFDIDDTICDNSRTNNEKSPVSDIDILENPLGNSTKLEISMRSNFLSPVSSNSEKKKKKNKHKKEFIDTLLNSTLGMTKKKKKKNDKKDADEDIPLSYNFVNDYNLSESEHGSPSKKKKKKKSSKEFANSYIEGPDYLSCTESEGKKKKRKRESEVLSCQLGDQSFIEVEGKKKKIKVESETPLGNSTKLEISMRSDFLSPDSSNSEKKKKKNKHKKEFIEGLSCKLGDQSFIEVDGKKEKIKVESYPVDRSFDSHEMFENVTMRKKKKYEIN